MPDFRILKRVKNLVKIQRELLNDSKQPFTAARS
jgi:hypothetical protein